MPFPLPCSSPAAYPSLWAMVYPDGNRLWRTRAPQASVIVSPHLPPSNGQPFPLSVIAKRQNKPFTSHTKNNTPSHPNSTSHHITLTGRDSFNFHEFLFPPKLQPPKAQKKTPKKATCTHTRYRIPTPSISTSNHPQTPTDRPERKSVLCVQHTFKVGNQASCLVVSSSRLGGVSDGRRTVHYPPPRSSLSRPSPFPF